MRLLLLLLIFARNGASTAVDTLLSPLPPSRAAEATAAAASGAWPIPAISIPAYVITLKRTPQRFAQFEEDGRPFRVLPRLARHEGVDGKLLSSLNDDRFSIVARLNMQRGTRRAHSDLVTLGMAGLYISHVDVWQRFLSETGDALAIVLEDDAVVPNDLTTRMDDAMRRMPPPGEWDVWILGAIVVTASAQAPGATRGLNEVKGYGGTQAYVITRRGAARLIALSYPMQTQVDAFMSQAAELGLIRTLWFADSSVNVPQRFRIMNQGSTVQQTYCDLCDLPHDYSRLRDVGTWLLVGMCATLLIQRLRCAQWRAFAAYVRRVCTSLRAPGAALRGPKHPGIV